MGGKSTSTRQTPAATLRGRGRPIGALASLALVVIAVVLAFVGADGDDDSRPRSTPPQIVPRGDLISLESSLDHPIYWAGERAPSELELATEVDGSVYLRYLPPGTVPGGEPAAFLTVGTYPVLDAAAAVRRVAESAGSEVKSVRGAVVATNPASRGSVYLAYPGSDLQIEVYDPVPGRAMKLIRTGAIRPAGEG